MDKCEIEIDGLRGEEEQHIWTFRWLWIINLAAIIWSIAVRHWDVLVIAILSATVAIIGIGRARRGRRLVERVAKECLPQTEAASETPEQE